MERRPPTKEEARVSETLSAQHLDKNSETITISEMAEMLARVYGKDSGYVIARYATGDCPYWEKVSLVIKG